MNIEQSGGIRSGLLSRINSIVAITIWFGTSERPALLTIPSVCIFGEKQIGAIVQNLVRRTINRF
jgi:hypothetical protein